MNTTQDAIAQEMRNLEGYDSEQRKQILTEAMIEASKRRNALQSIVRGSDIHHDDKDFRAEIESRIDADTQIISECYKALKELDTE